MLDLNSTGGWKGAATDSSDAASEMLFNTVAQVVAETAAAIVCRTQT